MLAAYRFVKRVFSILKGLSNDSVYFKLNGVEFTVNNKGDLIIENFRALQVNGKLCFIMYTPEEKEFMESYKENPDKITDKYYDDSTKTAGCSSVLSNMPTVKSPCARSCVNSQADSVNRK